VASSGLKVLVVLLIGGVVAASSRTIACHLTSFCVYAIVSGLPLMVELLAHYGRDGAIVAAYVFLFTLLMLGLGRNFRDTISRTLRLQFENADLAAQLQRDIAARRAAEAALRESEERLRFAQYALDHAQDMVAIVDRNGTLLHVTEAVCRQTGRTADELCGRKISAGVLAVSPDSSPRWWEDTRRLGTFTFEAEVLHRSGRGTPVEVNASHVEFNGREAICAIARDLAPRRAAEQEKARMQQQLQETQRLESLGVLAGGVAHDFNNLLTAILGNASMARDTVGERGTVSDMLGQIETAANQAAGLCRQMLAYAGRGELLVQPLNLSTVVAESTKLLDMTVGHRAHLELQLDPDLPSIRADTSQLRQIVLNLVHNAAEAISRTDGRITVTTQPVQVDQALIAAARLHTDIPVGPGVALVVSDNGCGMDRDTLEHIFEPFFTTKFTGRGLGLPAVVGIVRSHHALLQVESTPGQGSTFRVIFAAAETGAETKAAAPAPLQLLPNVRVLVVDDEDAVRLVAQRVFERLGLTVEVAVDGRSALALLDHDPNRFSLLLVDMTMPGMDGATTLREMRRRGATGPAIMMSGLSEQQVRAVLGPEHPAEFLAKPFDVAALRAKAEAVLPAEPPHAAVAAAPERRC
jgi:PAS domain S-box-containing protein